ncbi:unnamed protein product [Lasius platythorax]|uniref:Uncharacterized protein n=1 Tax=Lasius platythorax TaxID=488582 RepID=A0AAV2NRM0_9HYME
MPLRHVTGQGRDAYLYGWMSTRSMEVASKGQGRVTSPLFNIFGPFHPIGGKGPIAEAEEEAIERCAATTRLGRSRVRHSGDSDDALYRGKRRGISDQVRSILIYLF